MADPQKWGLPYVVSFVIIGFLECICLDVRRMKILVFLIG